MVGWGNIWFHGALEWVCLSEVAVDTDVDFVPAIRNLVGFDNLMGRGG